MKNDCSVFSVMLHIKLFKHQPHVFDIILKKNILSKNKLMTLIEFSYSQGQPEESIATTK